MEYDKIVIEKTNLKIMSGCFNETGNNKIKVITIDNKEFMFLTDLARYANPEEPKIPIQTWMRNKDVIAYLGLWEKLNNENFKGHEFTTLLERTPKYDNYDNKEVITFCIVK